MSLYVAGLWRYPVKTLAGERLPMTTLTTRVCRSTASCRCTGPRAYGRRAAITRCLDCGERWTTTVALSSTGTRWDSPEALALVQGAAGADAWLEAYAGPERFDVLPLLVATDGAVEAFGRDVRRLRPNILIGGVEGMEEAQWPGAELHIGDAIVRLDSLRGRCPMTTVDPDTLERDPEVLRDIGRRFGGRLALNAEVVRGGQVRVGDTVTLTFPNR